MELHPVPCQPEPEVQRGLGGQRFPCRRRRIRPFTLCELARRLQRLVRLNGRVRKAGESGGNIRNDVYCGIAGRGDATAAGTARDRAGGLRSSLQQSPALHYRIARYAHADFTQPAPHRDEPRPAVTRGLGRPHHQFGRYRRHSGHSASVESA